ncbi:MAG: hypothetical protein IT373_36705 [Polyangiaceae bacterium]|nr:hypothetical protein [Polyangiaceae bacterium]
MTDPTVAYSPPRAGDWGETRTERDASTRSVVTLVAGCVLVVAVVVVGASAAAERRIAGGLGGGATARVASALFWLVSIAAVVAASAWWRRRDELVLTKLGVRCSVTGLLGQRALFFLPWHEVVDAAAAQHGGEECLFVTTQSGVRYAPWVFDGSAAAWAAEIRRHAERVREASLRDADEGGAPDDLAELGYAGATTRTGSRWCGPFVVCVLACGAPATATAVEHGAVGTLFALGAGLALGPFAVLRAVGLVAALRARHRVLARVRRALAPDAGDPRVAVGASVAGARGVETVRRGRIRVLEAVKGPSGPCAAYLVRRPATGRRSTRSSAAGRLELETSDGERVTLAAGAWEVLDPFDGTVLDAEGCVVDGTDVVASGPVVALPGAEGSYRSAAPRYELRPGWLAPVDGRLSGSRVRTRDGTAVVVHAALAVAGLALAALASDLYLRGTPAGPTQPSPAAEAGATL